MSRKILSTSSFDLLCTDISEILQKTFSFHHLSIWMYSSKTKESILKAKTGVAPYAKEIESSYPVNMGMIGYCIRSKKMVLANDVSKNRYYFHFPGLETKSELCAPMKMNNEILGVLNVESDRLNAFSEKDVTLIETIADLCALAIHQSKLYLLEEENTSLKIFISEKFSSAASKIIGKSRPIRNLLTMVDRIAPTRATILIQGESGTGKELIARQIHEKSDRSYAPYVAMNCSAFNENLLKSELFGHEKGAFTGAHSLKMGLVETAHTGTLFLDEVGEMGKEMQSKFLRFLQEGEFYRVGGKTPLKVNVRIISATNKDLETEVQEGRFREDLYYRLNTITLRVPSLRKRTEDIESLVDFFLKSDSRGYTKVKKISQDALELLKKYHWPGNVRELQNIIERLKILSDGDTIMVQDILNHIKFSSKIKEDLADPRKIMALYDVEKRYVLQTLDFYQGNKTKTASVLGITLKTLYNKLNQYQDFTTADL